MVKVYGTGGIYSPSKAGIVATFPAGRYDGDGYFQNSFIETDDKEIIDLAKLNGLKIEGEIDVPKADKPAKTSKADKNSPDADAPGDETEK